MNQLGPFTGLPAALATLVSNLGIARYLKT